MSDKAMRATYSAHGLEIDVGPNPTRARSRSRSGRKKAAMYPMTRCCWTVIRVMRRSGSVSSTFWSTVWSSSARPSERERLLEKGRKVGRLGHFRTQPREEMVHLPPNRVAEHLVASTGEHPVDGRPRHAGCARDVVDGRLRHPELRDALVTRREHALARHQNPSSGSRPIVRPGRSRTARIARSTPGMNDVRS